VIEKVKAEKPAEPAPTPKDKGEEDEEILKMRGSISSMRRKLNSALSRSSAARSSTRPRLRSFDSSRMASTRRRRSRDDYVPVLAEHFMGQVKLQNDGKVLLGIKRAPAKGLPPEDMDVELTDGIAAWTKRAPGCQRPQRRRRKRRHDRLRCRSLHARPHLRPRVRRIRSMTRFARGAATRRNRHRYGETLKRRYMFASRVRLSDDTDPPTSPPFPPWPTTVAGSLVRGGGSGSVGDPPVTCFSSFAVSVLGVFLLSDMSTTVTKRPSSVCDIRHPVGPEPMPFS
jgi:hypothetical protein